MEGLQFDQGFRLRFLEAVPKKVDEFQRAIGKANEMSVVVREGEEPKRQQRKRYGGNRMIVSDQMSLCLGSLHHQTAPCVVV